MNRRKFLLGSSLAAAASTLAPAQRLTPADQDSNSFSFAFFTDVHLEPELDAPQGTELAFELINSSDAAFAICGGDHVFDALSASRQSILEQYQLYTQAEKTLRIPVRHVLGNHDVVGAASGSDIKSHDPIYGKRLFEQTFNTPTYYSFTFGGVQFLVLDSIVTRGREWLPEIDAAQLVWLQRELQADLTFPKIVISHVPLATSIFNYAPGSNDRAYMPVLNGHIVIPMLEKSNVVAVLQGHTHIVESVSHHGIEFVTGGAVCGNWWHGTHFGDREGVTFVTVNPQEKTIETRYAPTGFVTTDPRNT